MKGGKRLAAVEAELIGGECAYWACIPSKTLLRATNLLEIPGQAVILGGGARGVEPGTGRRPRTDGLGLESAGVTLDERGATLVDESCRAAPGIWAIGDVNAIMTFTHVGMYQGRIVADTILGRRQRPAPRRLN
ncbi:pyruvate/2-oxoglutarate dehydrogenase complex dihydrolipoamide dehydrogenase (E3) component [Cryobacterium sp. CAN_C3]|uniref:FAD-dependent oxidoreductase n=1 Tax=unclassified Cryobacterium TaxID=2649013 RepID=UPI001A2D7B7B|nr:pyruvate/2-oxoglutarate dehydrogenase complex dihydrolipoamide dehydrogenase (E3) component [Cryobacterium sp. CAN_C3]